MFVTLLSVTRLLTSGYCLHQCESVLKLVAQFHESSVIFKDHNPLDDTGEEDKATQSPRGQARRRIAMATEERETLGGLAAKVCREIEQVFESAEVQNADPLGRMVNEILNTATAGGRIVVHGVGREGLMMKGLAMRLFHLGLESHCVGDMTVPSIGPQDLLVASAGPGGFSTVDAICGRAREAGARVLLLTAQPGGSAAQFADVMAVVPAQTMADDHMTVKPKAQYSSVLPMGSLYEGALFVLFEMVILRLRAALGQTAETMRSRHTNLE